MGQGGSYLSRQYAPAWGILIGTVVGVPLGIATHPSVIGVLALLGLLIGTVTYYEGKKSSTKDRTE